LRDFYIFDENSLIYSIDQKLIQQCNQFVTMSGFDSLRGADLIFACIAMLENAYLVTLDNHFRSVSNYINVINLNESRENPVYRRKFGV
jgi:predicted nucleic acid-binding protein